MNEFKVTDAVKRFSIINVSRGNAILIIKCQGKVIPGFKQVCGRGLLSVIGINRLISLL